MASSLHPLPRNARIHKSLESAVGGADLAPLGDLLPASASPRHLGAAPIERAERAKGSARSRTERRLTDQPAIPGAVVAQTGVARCAEAPPAAEAQSASTGRAVRHLPTPHRLHYRLCRSHVRIGEAGYSHPSWTRAG